MKKYDIYNYRYYFEDNPTRAMVRPGIILDQGVIIPIMKITGGEHGQRTPNDYILKDWDSEGLKKPSIARCDKIQPTSIKDIYQYKGHLSDEDIANIEQIMRGVNVEEQLCFTEAFDGTIYNEGALYEKFNRLFEAENVPTVIAFGRLNPPTLGHRKLVDTMTSLTNWEKARLYLSHTQDKKKNPLSYEDKIHFAKEAFEPQIDVVESDARTIIEVLADLYKEGIKNIIYVGGEDRIGGKEDVSDLILRYNGQPDKQGNILYDFDSIQFKNAGARSDDSDDLIERASASLARKYAQEGDFEHFKEIVPVEDAELLYKKVREGLGLKEELDEADENVFTSTDIKNKHKSGWNSANSIKDIYDLLLSEVSGNIDENTEKLLKNTMRDIESLTNSLNVSTLTALNKKLADSVGLSANEFVKLFKPSQEDLNVLLKDGGLSFEKTFGNGGTMNLGSIGLSKNLLDELIKYKGGAKDSTTNTGPYEFLFALIFKNGTMKTGGAGDVKIGDYQIEVKSVLKDAVIGNDSNTNDIIRAFDDFVFINLNKGQKGSTRPSCNSKSFNININGSELPDIIRQKLNIQDTATISYEKLFNNVFEYIIKEYSKRFNYLALCRAYDVEMVPSDRVANELLGNSRYYITLADYVSGRFFKIRKRAK